MIYGNSNISVILEKYEISVYWLILDEPALFPPEARPEDQEIMVPVAPSCYQSKCSAHGCNSLYVS